MGNKWTGKKKDCGCYKRSENAPNYKKWQFNKFKGEPVEIVYTGKLASVEIADLKKENAKLKEQLETQAVKYFAKTQEIQSQMEATMEAGYEEAYCRIVGLLDELDEKDEVIETQTARIASLEKKLEKWTSAGKT